MNDHTDKAREVIAFCAGVPLVQVTNDVDLVACLGMDSIELLELAMALENEFEIEVPDDDWEACSTVADVLALLDRFGAKTND